MNICYYCQDKIQPSEDFLIVQPDQTQVHVCSECMSDILKFFKSGEAEEKKIAELSVDATAKAFLGVSMKHRALCSVDNDGRIVQVFSNSDVTSYSLQRSPMLDKWYGPALTAYSGNMRYDEPIHYHTTVDLHCLLRREGPPIIIDR